MNRLFRTSSQQLGSWVYGCSARIPPVRRRLYGSHRNTYIQRFISKYDLLRFFQQRRALPDEFGIGLDERVIEYPWVLSRLLKYQEKCRFLDAGSTLNHEMILHHPLVKRHKWTILTLAPESECFWDLGVSYAYEDLRSMPFRDQWFDAAFCVSVIEHVGMDNVSYTPDKSYRESRAQDYLQAIDELKRVLRPGGWLYLTVPFGSYENHGWLQQFDSSMLSRLVAHFEPQRTDKTFFRYSDQGWNLATEEECRNSYYCHIDAGRFSKALDRKRYDMNFTAAASAVVCIELQK